MKYYDIINRVLLITAITLPLLCSKATAENYRSDLIGLPASQLPGVVGAPNDKHENDLTKMKVWYYQDFKVLIAKDKVIAVKSKHLMKSPALPEKKKLRQEMQEKKKVALPEVDAETFEDILGELEKKSAKKEEDPKLKKLRELGKRANTMIQKR